MATVVAEGSDSFDCGKRTVVELETSIEVLMADDGDVVVDGGYLGSAYANEPSITDASVEGRDSDGRGVADVAGCLIGAKGEDDLYGRGGGEVPLGGDRHDTFPSLTSSEWSGEERAVIHYGASVGGGGN